MKLHWSPRSPFVRKVMITLHETGLLDRVECVRTLVGASIPPSDEILRDNPLGKIPTLVLDDGSSLFDSRVICEHLIDEAGMRSLLPAEGAARWQQLRWQAFGDGLIDVLLLMRTEFLRDHPEAAILEGFRRKAFASFGMLEAEAPALGAAEFGIGQITLACAIGQLDLRYARSNWRQAYPALAQWYAGVASRPSIVATQVVDDAAPTGKDSHSLIDFTQGR